MAFGGTNILARGAIRFIIAFGVIAIMLTVMGMIDLGKDAFGSHKNFADMEKTDFKVGDIVHGRINETIGCAATMTTTETMMYLVETDKYTSAAYYVIPYFDSVDDPYPDKILLYRTGNKKQMSDLDALVDETIYWYADMRDGTSTRVDVDRAEVTELSSEEREAFYDYLDKFVDAYYRNESSQTRDYLKISYQDAAVPYLLKYNAGGGGTMLTIGIAMLAIFIVGIIIFILKRRRSESAVPQYTYVGAANPMNDPNLNSPTGLRNASDNPYFSSQPGAAASPGALPRQTNTLPRQTNGYRTDYSSSERPMPPVTPPTQQNRYKNREMNFDPFTGKPIEKKTLVDGVFGGQTGTAQPMRRSPLSRPTGAVPPPVGDSMPSVDPKTEENVDLSNGGISWEEKVERNIGMPKNGNIPVINPESHSAATMFGTIIPVEAETHKPAPAPAPEPEAPVTEVEEIHPPTREDNVRSDIQVEQTDPETRNIYSYMAGGQMNAVDPYTEKNVDVSNGGIELSDDDPDAELRRSFESYMKSEAPVPSFPTAEPLRPEPAPEPAKTEPVRTVGSVPPYISAPVQPAPSPAAPEPSGSDDYNIFKTGSDSYNIFKTPAPGSDSSANMGFPVENRDFPKVDTSFPEPGESDVGGKDDFIF